MITELFLLGLTAEELRANIDWKLPFLNGVGEFGPKIRVATTGRVLLAILLVTKLDGLTFHRV